MMRKAISYEVAFSFCIFGRAPTVLARVISIITQPQQFVKQKVAQLFGFWISHFRAICHLDFLLLFCYNLITKRKGNDPMITYEMIADAQKTLVDFWGDDGKKVIEFCAKAQPFNNSSKQFLNHCTACGGNWGGMLLTGVHELWPDVWEAIPEDMGCFAWTCICSVLILCGVDTSE